MTELRDASSLHPLFRAMVLMGGSLALQCGGTVSHQDSATGGNAAGGAGGSGGTPTFGGNASGGTTASGGSAITIGTGGAAEPVMPGPFSCPPAQWDCRATPPSCWGQFYELPAECACDPKRPPTPADCVNSDWVCRHATHDSQHRLLTTPVDFECNCAPHADSCRVACEGLSGYSAGCSQPGPAMNAVLCDCAVIVLR